MDSQGPPEGSRKKQPVENAERKQNVEELVTPVTRAVTVTPARCNVETEETQSRLLFVALAEEGELQDSSTGNGTQKNTDTQSGSSKLQNGDFQLDLDRQNYQFFTVP